MRAFVTGGSGFLGRELLGTLAARGVETRALARSSAARDTVFRRGAVAVPGDLDDVAAMRDGMAGCDVVFHLAGKVEIWGPREEFQRVNVQGTENVLQAARLAGVPRVVHVSSESVLFGGAPLRDVDESAPLPVRPLGPYAWSKGVAEQRVRAANDAALATVVVRPRFIWGRGDTSVLPQFAEAVRRGGFAWIGGGRYRTSTCHVRNVCEGLLCAAERGRPGQVYFVTDGAPVEFRGFLTALLRTQGLEPGDRSVPRWVARAVAGAAESAWSALRLRGEPPLHRAALNTIGDEVTVRDDKARREIGYQGAVSREQGLSEMQLPA